MGARIRNIRRSSKKRVTTTTTTNTKKTSSIVLSEKQLENLSGYIVLVAV
jgi:hypothetical protein